MTPLAEKMLGGGPIEPEAIPALAAHGVTMIVNNRPDHEEPGQPLAAQIEAAAREAGLDYRHIPVAGGMAPQQVQAMAEALDSAQGKVFAFCKSGTRSTWLWALAEAQRGAEAESSIRKAAEAGYDIEALRPYL